MEYSHENICCLNCPAGTFVKKACLAASGIGECEPCEFDTYTEHNNGLWRCISCVKCRSDQETIDKCTSIQNTKCKCKKGSFCLPDQACEVCKKCSRCKEDEEVVKSCTEISNTSDTEDDEQEDKQNAHNSKIEDLTHCQPFLEQNSVVGPGAPASIETERDRGLGESLTNTATSSQSSLALCTLPSASQFCHTNQSSASCALALDPESSRRLIPLNGEESLKKTFDFFEEMDVHYHNRFFRFIGLSDNAIKSAEALFPDDRVYELLKNWMEKEGLKADFNILIEALIKLDQRLSAENIISRAIGNGYYKYEDE
ncbi:hypothetical protein DNTS_023696 [Danionella cerebrum]|nr:hypothetical protein DNTS_023696 [Danionella translucida]